jgi:hypothetical protein
VYAKKHPEAMYKSRSESQMRHRYGSGYDLDARDSLLMEQRNACAICGRTGLVWGKGYNDTWHTDHEHGKEGTHRGILCATCNMALGRLEPHIIRLIQYLVKYDKTELIEFLRNLNDQYRDDTTDYELGQEDDIQSSLGNRQLS